MNEQHEATKDTESTPMKKVLKIVHVDFKEQVCYVDNLVGVSNILEYTLEQRIKALEESDSERSDDPA